MQHSINTTSRWLDGSPVHFFASVSAAAVLAACVILATSAYAESKAECSYTGLTELTNFGDNPGGLKGYYFTPDDLPPNAPLVVGLHGCGQRACDYDDETDWTDLAQRFKFALLLPEQQKVTPDWFNYYGNDAQCFSWWETSYQERGSGEPASIMNMVKWMVDKFTLDPGRIYITGLSAGAGMTVVMLSNYPDCFAGGAPIAGVPFNCAGDGVIGHAVGEECMCMKGVPGYAQCAQMKDPLPKSAKVWGDAVREKTCTKLSPQGDTYCPDTAPGGKWPRISIWQGANDVMVAPVNLNRLMLQWTDLHHINPANGKSVTRNAPPYRTKHTTYADRNGRILVETYLLDSKLPPQQVPGTGHATAVDPDKGCGCDHTDCACEKGGVCTTANETGYIKDANVCSSLRIAQFWGIDKPAKKPAAGASPAPRCEPHPPRHAPHAAARRAKR
jgi:poly(hydroxyalkanoate) depolymerase family esterase